MTEVLPRGLGSRAVALAFAPILSARLHALYDLALDEELPPEWRELAGAAAGPMGIGAPASAGEPAMEVEPPSGLRILLVEDDGLIRMTSAELLRSFGHLVHEAEDGDEALALLDDWLIDLLITDVNLPAYSGVELAQRAIARAPLLRVIFATGMRASALGDNLPARSLFVAKPYGERELRRAIAAVILL